MHTGILSYKYLFLFFLFKKLIINVCTILILITIIFNTYKTSYKMDETNFNLRIDILKSTWRTNLEVKFNIIFFVLVIYYNFNKSKKKLIK